MNQGRACSVEPVPLAAQASIPLLGRAVVKGSEFGQRSWKLCPGTARFLQRKSLPFSVFISLCVGGED